MQYIHDYDTLISINNIKMLSSTIRNNLMMAGFATLADLEKYIAENDISDIAGIDKYAKAEIDEFFDQYRQQDYEIEIILYNTQENIRKKAERKTAERIEKKLILSEEERMQIIFPYVNPELKQQPMFSLSSAGFSSLSINNLWRKMGFYYIGDLEGLTKGELFDCCSNYQTIENFVAKAELLHLNAAELLEYVFKSFQDTTNYRVALLKARDVKSEDICSMLNLKSITSIPKRFGNFREKIEPYIETIIKLMDEDDTEQIIQNLSTTFENDEFNEIIVHCYRKFLSKEGYTIHLH